MNPKLAKVRAGKHYTVFRRSHTAEEAAVLAMNAQRGTCCRCGCTDNNACFAGCWWTDLTETLCSRCAS